MDNLIFTFFPSLPPSFSPPEWNCVFCSVSSIFSPPRSPLPPLRPLQSPQCCLSCRRSWQLPPRTQRPSLCWITRRDSFSPLILIGCSPLHRPVRRSCGRLTGLWSELWPTARLCLSARTKAARCRQRATTVFRAEPSGYARCCRSCWKLWVKVRGRTCCWL